MKKNSRLLLFLAVAGITVIVTGKILAEPAEKTGTGELNTVLVGNKSEVELRTGMRKLWDDHVVWTRNVIFCILDDLPGTDQALNRLMKNQDDIGDAIKPYYGADAGKKLSDLLKTHISISGDLLKALKKDDNKAFDDANKKWSANADEIAEFLNKANPDNWKLSDMKSMMHDHLKYTTDEAQARKMKKYDNDVKEFDKVDNQISKMANMLSDGIVKQFPDKFKNMEMGMGK